MSRGALEGWRRLPTRTERQTDGPDENRSRVRELFYARLRRAPSKWTVEGSLPVLFFGDVAAARVATVGLNPSDREYLSDSGSLLDGAAQRFATLASLRAADRASLTDTQCEEAIEWMRHYFDPGRPVYSSYFLTLGHFLNGWGVDFTDGTAVHLDVVQEATQPRWSGLARAARQALVGTDLPFLAEQVRLLGVHAVICTGATVSSLVKAQLGVEVRGTGTLELEGWWVGNATVGEWTLPVAGWNRPLHQPTGLGTKGERRLGGLLRQELGL
jgi:hypothetical protein